MAAAMQPEAQPTPTASRIHVAGVGARITHA